MGRVKAAPRGPNSRACGLNLEARDLQEAGLVGGVDLQVFRDIAKDLPESPRAGVDPTPDVRASVDWDFLEAQATW